VTVFVTTHYLEEAEHCHRLALIHAGRLATVGTVDEVKAVLRGRAVLEVHAPRVADALETLAAQPFAHEVSVFGTRLHVLVDDPVEGVRQVVAALEAAGNAPATAERIVPSLEDVFIHLVQGQEAKRVAAGAGV
jgi:ABC-2 type transport system ATP-binding protein